jgi:hypothetical protein
MLQELTFVDSVLLITVFDSAAVRCKFSCKNTPKFNARAVRLSRVPVNGSFLLLVFLRKYDKTVSYHLYIVNRYLWY